MNDDFDKNFSSFEKMFKWVFTLGIGWFIICAVLGTILTIALIALIIVAIMALI